MSEEEDWYSWADIDWDVVCPSPPKKRKVPIDKFLALFAGLQRTLRLDSLAIKHMMRKILRFEPFCLEVSETTKSIQNGLRARLLLFYAHERFAGFYPPKYTIRGVVYSPCKVSGLPFFKVWLQRLTKMHDELLKGSIWETHPITDAHVCCWGLAYWSAPSELFIQSQCEKLKEELRAWHNAK